MRNFVRKIKLAVINDDPIARNAEYMVLRDYQYHTWNLANKIVQGQFFLKIFEEMLLYKHPETYEKLKGIQRQISLINTEKTPERKSTLKLLYDQINELKKGHKDEFDVFLKNQSIQNFTYGSNANEYGDILPSTIRTTLNAKVFSDFNNKWKEFKTGSASVQTYKRTIPVPFQKKAITDFKKEEDGSFTFRMFKIKFKCLLGKDLNNTAHILESLLNMTGQFEMGDSAYTFDGKDLFWLCNLKTDVVQSVQDKNIIAGVDLGITRMATMIIRDVTSSSTTNYVERKFYGDDTLMKKVTHLRNKNSNLTRYSLGKTGKGRLHALGKKQEFLTKMGNFRDSYNKKIASLIVQRCVANRVSTIIIEDLSGIGEISKFLKDWPYYDLQTKIKQKAAEHGIEVRSNPAEYTSQTCPACNHVHKDNRKTQKEFACVNCDYKANADVVGAINLINFDQGISAQKKRTKNKGKTVEDVA